MKEVAEPFHVNETKQIVCYAATMITSEGFWQKENPLNYALPLFLLQLMLILVVTRLFIFILKPIRQPRVISELMVAPLPYNDNNFISFSTMNPIIVLNHN